MTDPTTRAIERVCDGWRTAVVIPFPSPSERLARQSRKWLRIYTKPINNPPSAA